MSMGQVVLLVFESTLILIVSDYAWRVTHFKATYVAVGAVAVWIGVVWLTLVFQ